jgi:hypothetical protein
MGALGILARLGARSTSSRLVSPEHAKREGNAGSAKKGLNVSGAAQIAESGGKAYVMLYLAPSEHYYAASLAEVEKAFTSATLK